MIYKRLFSLIAIFFIYEGALAQKFTVGPVLGLHAYKVAFHHDEEQQHLESKIKPGYKGGVYITFPLEENFAWTIEGYYSKKGRKISYYEGKNINDASYTFLEFSTLLRKSYDLTIGKGIPGKFFFNIGPNVNYWIDGKGQIDSNVDLDYTVEFGDPGNNISTNYITGANRWMYGLELGAGIESKIYNTQSIQFELRFTYGHTYLGGQSSSNIPIMHFEDSLRSNYRVLTFLVRYGLDVDLRLARKGKSTIKRR